MCVTPKLGCFPVLHSLKMDRLKTSLLIAILFALPAFPAEAAIWEAAEELSLTIPVSDDLYAAGGIVLIDKGVRGDLVAAGGEVTIRGTVEDDLNVLGGRLYLEGDVGDDARIVGGEITIDGAVGDDLIVAGGKVRISDSAVIKGDAVVTGGELIVDGTIRGNLLVRGGDISISGSVKGDADIRSQNLRLDGEISGNAILVAETIHLSKDASFAGDIRYWVPEGAFDFAGALRTGTSTFDKELQLPDFDVSAKVGTGLKAGLLALIGYSLFAAAFIILILILITKNYFKDTAKVLKETPWKSVLIGFLYFALLPIVALLFLISVIGIPIALFLLVSYAFAIYFSKMLTAIVFATWVNLHYKKKWGKPMLFLMSVVSYLALRIVGLMPIIGWIVVMFAVFAAFGALVMSKYEKINKIR